MSTYGQFQNCISPHHLFSLGHSVLLSCFELGCGGAEREQDTPKTLKVSLVVGVSCVLSLWSLALIQGLGVPRKRVFLAPSKSTDTRKCMCLSHFAFYFILACYNFL